MHPAPSDTLPAQLRAFAEGVRGFLPADEAIALHEAGLRGGPVGPLLEIGSWCGKSAVYLGAAARATGTRLVTIDHHRGSEEHQPGWEYHEPDLVDAHAGRIDTLPELRRTLHDAGLEDVVIAVVGRSLDVAALWGTPLGLVFLDGSHTEASAQSDYAAWAPHVAAGGLLAIHDVFPDPADGGRAPFHVYERALASGAFTEQTATGSLRILQRAADVW